MFKAQRSLIAMSVLVASVGGLSQAHARSPMKFFFPMLKRSMKPALGGPAGESATKCEIAEKEVHINGENVSSTQYTDEVPNFQAMLDLIKKSRQGRLKELPAPQGGSLVSYTASVTELGSVETTLKSRNSKKQQINDSNAARTLIDFIDLNCDQ